MPRLDITIPHQLPRQEALTRIQGLLKKLQKEQEGTISNVSEQWNGNEGEFSFSAKGFALSGSLKVEEESVIINGRLPLALVIFRSAIADAIQKKAGELLAT